MRIVTNIKLCQKINIATENLILNRIFLNFKLQALLKCKNVESYYD